VLALQLPQYARGRVWSYCSIGTCRHGFVEGIWWVEEKSRQRLDQANSLILERLHAPSNKEFDIVRFGVVIVLGVSMRKWC
jgi:hypothetical protein